MNFFTRYLRKLYDYVMNLAGHPQAEKALALVSLAESSFFPIPPDVMLIPMILAERLKAWRYAFICTISSVIGGLLGYMLGAFFFEYIAEPILSFYGHGAKFNSFKDQFNQWGIWIVIVFGLTPFPYKVITIASGVTGLPIVMFTLSSLFARGLRFFAVAGLIYWFGPPIRVFIEKYLGWLFLFGCIMLIGGFVAVRYLI